MDATKTMERLKHELRTGGLVNAALADLEQYSAVLCHPNAFTFFGAREFPQVCETVRVNFSRAHIQSLQSQVVKLQDHITALNTSNVRLQRWVIALASAALITSGTQVGLQLESRLQRPASLLPAATMQSETPSPRATPSSDPAIRNSP